MFMRFLQMVSMPEIDTLTRRGQAAGTLKAIKTAAKLVQ